MIKTSKNILEEIMVSSKIVVRNDSLRYGFSQTNLCFLSKEESSSNR